MCRKTIGGGWGDASDLGMSFFSLSGELDITIIFPESIVRTELIIKVPVLLQIDLLLVFLEIGLTSLCFLTYKLEIYT